MFFSSDVDKKVLGRLLGAGSLLFGLFLFLVTRPGQTILNEYQYRRIMAWLSPAAWAEESYQQAYSVLAIGSGGMAGRLGDALGTMPAVIKSGFLPEPHTDFIMAAAGQELGFAGCAGIIFLELWLTIRCLSLGTKAPDREGRLFCAGMAAWIGGQSLINMGVASGLLPNTGLTLPFVSYGLTSLISLYMGLGIAVNVGIQRKQSGGGRERKNIVHW